MAPEPRKKRVDLSGLPTFRDKSDVAERHDEYLAEGRAAELGLAKKRRFRPEDRH